jgi:hypothetical protein
VIEDLFRLLARPEIPWLLSAAIALGALLLWGAFRSRLEPVLAALDRAIAVVEETDGPASFRNRFPAISRELAANPVLGEVWRAFAVTLEPAPRTGEVLGYTRRPQEHFDDSLLLSTGFNIRFYQAVPNLLVGLGLLFTFVGLVAALHFASGGVRAPDVAMAQAALGDLLAAATFKFATSIAGLGSSILFSWREKAQLHRAHARILRFCHALEARTVPVTAESVALAQLEELRRQSADLQRLARGGFEGLPEGVERALAAEVRVAFAPLRSALAELATRLGREPTWLAEAMLGPAPVAGRRHVGPAAVESGGPRELGPALLQELREIRRSLERAAAGGSGSPAGGASTPPLAAAGLVVAAARTEGRLGRILDALRALYPRLAVGARDARLREELTPLLRDLYVRVQEGAQAVRRLRTGAATEGAGEEAAVLGRLEAGLDEAGRRLGELVREIGDLSAASGDRP